MPKKVLKGLVLAITIILITLSFSGCDQIMDLIGMGDDDTELNSNQILLKKLLGAMDKSTQEIQAYSQAHNSEGYPAFLPDGFMYTDSGNVRTRTFTNYTNADGAVLNGTDKITFGGTPPMGGIVAGDMDITFSGAYIGSTKNLVLKKSRTPPAPMTCTECKVDGVDMKADFISMQQ